METPGNSKATGSLKNSRPQLPRSGSIWQAEMSASATQTVTKERQKLSVVSWALAKIQGKLHDKSVHGNDGHSKSSEKLKVTRCCGFLKIRSLEKRE